MRPPERDYSHRSRLDKLGVRLGSAVRLIGLEDAVFLAELRERGAQLDAQPPLDLVFVHVSDPSELERLSEIRRWLDPAGAIWVVRTKGNSRVMTETDIIDAGKRHGLVDNKIVSFSETLSAMRLVIPVAQRSQRGGE